MSFNSNLPADLAEIDAGELRNQFNGLKTLIDGMFPVGCVAGYLKSLNNVPALPGTWAECNGQAVVDAECTLHPGDVLFIPGWLFSSVVYAIFLRNVLFIPGSVWGTNFDKISYVFQPRNYRCFRYTFSHFGHFEFNY